MCMGISELQHCGEPFCFCFWRRFCFVINAMYVCRSVRSVSLSNGFMYRVGDGIRVVFGSQDA